MVKKGSQISLRKLKNPIKHLIAKFHLTVLLQNPITKHIHSSCLDVVKEAKLRERQSPDPAVLDFSSPLDVSIVFFARETMLNV